MRPAGLLQAFRLPRGSITRSPVFRLSFEAFKGFFKGKESATAPAVASLASILSYRRSGFRMGQTLSRERKASIQVTGAIFKPVLQAVRIGSLKFSLMGGVYGW